MNGWTRYPFPPDQKGNFYEHLDTIVRLIGSSLYETRLENGVYYIRRAS